MATVSTAHTFGTITLHAVGHPDPQVARAGFRLNHPYIEVCWITVLGPTGVMLLRRVSDLWTGELSPTIDIADLAHMVGVGTGTGRQSPIWRTITRLERFRLARSAGPGQLEIFTELPPLDAPALGRCSTWTRDQHARILDAHLADLIVV